MPEEQNQQASGAGDPAAEAAVQAKIDAAVKAAVEKSAPKAAEQAKVPQLVLGKFRDGRSIDEQKFKQQVELLRDNPAYADAVLKELGLDRALSEADQLRGEMAQLKLDREREKILIKRQVPEELADFVQGATPQELDASAEKLMKSFDAAKKQAGGQAKPERPGNRTAVIPPMNGNANGKPMSVKEAMANITENWPGRA